MTLLLLLACTGYRPIDSSTTDTDADTDADTDTDTDTDTDADTDADPCDTAPTLTWDNFGQGFMDSYCQRCHASDATDRNGAPTTVIFDTEADVIANEDRIRARALGDSPTMPPEGGVPDEERALLELWLDCGL